MASRYCRSCKDFHDLSEPWPSACFGHFSRARSADGVQIIKDIDPYKSTITGEAITGRRQHRDHLRAHGCIEVGNEFKPHKPNWDVPGRVQDIQRAMERQRG